MPYIPQDYYAELRAAEHRAATAEARVKELEIENRRQSQIFHDNQWRQLKEMTAERDTAKAALQEALAETDKQKKAAVNWFAEANRDHNNLERALAREAEKDAVIEKAIEDLSWYNNVYPDAPLDLIMNKLASALSTTTPHPWGEVIRAAQNVDREFGGRLLPDKHVDLQDALNALSKALSALPTSAAPSDTAALIEAGRLAVELTEVGGDWWSCLYAGPARDIAARLHRACAAIVEKEKDRG